MVWSGAVLQTFCGHYEFVNCCCFNSRDQVAMIDRFWCGVHGPPNIVVPEEICSPFHHIRREETSRKGLTCLSGLDCWSDQGRFSGVFNQFDLICRSSP